MTGNDAAEHKPTIDRAVAHARNLRNRRVVRYITLGLMVLLGIIYMGSFFLYRGALQQSFETPAPRADQVAVVLVPKDVDPRAQLVTGDVLLFPGEDLVDGQGRLLKTLSVEIYPSVSNSVITFPEGRKPTPSRIDLPAAGVLQNYPFDKYTIQADVTTSLPSTVGETAGPTVPQQVSAYFKVSGWALSKGTVQNLPGDTATVVGTVQRSLPSIVIALIFVGLILAFGIMAVVLVRSCFTGRYKIDLFVSSWMTAALFALITLRDKLPGNPPLGSVIDIAVYFWVVAVIMLMIVTALSYLLFGGSDDDDADDEPKDQAESANPENAAVIEAARSDAQGTPDKPSKAAVGAAGDAAPEGEPTPA